MSSTEEIIKNAFSPTSLGMDKANAFKVLQSKYGKLEIEAIRELLMPFISETYGVPITRSQALRNFGSLCLDNTHVKYEVARKMLYRLSQKIKI